MVRVMTTETDELWPALPYEAWKDTYATLHMWTQVVGKVALAQAPPLNHSWAIALQVTPRGLSTRTLAHGHRTFTIQFDFIEHQLEIRTSDGDRESFALARRFPWRCAQKSFCLPPMACRTKTSPSS